MIITQATTMFPARASLPKIPAAETVSVARMFRLLRNRAFLIGMAATGLVFMGMNALSIYLRPFLEGVTGVGVNTLSLMLLGVGLGGLSGTSLIGFVLRRHLTAALIGPPGTVALIALLLIGFGSSPLATATLLVLWGFFSTPTPVAWNTWIAINAAKMICGGGHFFEVAAAPRMTSRMLAETLRWPNKR
jgi:predicted MFS family arabinose efflux permease